MCALECEAICKMNIGHDPRAMKGRWLVPINNGHCKVTACTDRPHARRRNQLGIESPESIALLGVFDVILIVAEGGDYCAVQFYIIVADKPGCLSLFENAAAA